MPSTLMKPFRRARAAAGRPDLRWHDLRHTAATMAKKVGAPDRVLMNRFGHSTNAASLRYQHFVDAEDQDLADKLSQMMGAPEQ